MIQNILRDVLLRPKRWMRVKVLSNSTTGSIEDADVEFEWICHAYRMSQNSDKFPLWFNFTCIDCDIPATSGLFDWYRGIYGDQNNNDTEDDKSPYDPYSALYTADDTFTERLTAPLLPLEKRRTLLIEHVSKDAWFGERVETSEHVVGTYPVGVRKHQQENSDKQQLLIHFKAQSSGQTKRF